ncbi:MFS family permease [Catenuloplanes nepalensis]|uniref:MFS family permease n=1 Tax=Catenuloplanes nepalensis TaxID=587533 RepID=A0ABT9MQT1_9ACTN|nr:MFS transporter [Catenuloplanes nepalensis]MDP9793790.1 MFS family permease [Catenuloplanes nepalensis]
MTGPAAFVVLWAGQFLSVVGTGVTTFGLGVWVYQDTGSVTRFALISVLASAPLVFLSPFAGALVDRWDRRTVMIVANLCSAACTCALVGLLLAGRLSIWHIYAATALTGGVTAFHWPAYAAATTLLVPKRHLGRAAGLAELSRAASLVLSPLIAGVLVAGVGIRAVLLVDGVTFLLAAVTLFGVRVPPPGADPAASPGHRSLLADVRYGARYLRDRPGLGRLLGVFSLMNLFCSFVPILVVPLIGTSGSARELGVTVTLGALGFLAGGVVMSAWGGPARRMHGIIGCGVAQGLAMIITGLRPWPALVVTGLFCFYFWIPIVNGSSQAIWQSKVPAYLQGRVFAIRRMVAQATTPIGYLLAGPLTDRVFGPAVAGGGAAAIVGTGPGRGAAALLVVLGVLAVATNLAALRSGRLMRLEDELPDASPAPLNDLGAARR